MPPRYAYGNVIERGKTRTIMAYSTRAREARVNYYSSPYGIVMNARSQTFQPIFFCSEVRWEIHREPQSQQCPEADRGKIYKISLLASWDAIEPGLVTE